MVLLNVAMAATDIFTLLYEGPDRPINFIILPVSMFLFYGLAFAVFIASGIEIMYFVDKPKFRKKVFKNAYDCDVCFRRHADYHSFHRPFIFNR